MPLVIPTIVLLRTLVPQNSVLKLSKLQTHKMLFYPLAFAGNIIATTDYSKNNLSYFEIQYD